MDPSNKERQLKWFGHLQRLPKEAPARVAYEEVNNKPVKKSEEVNLSPGKKI